MVFSALVHEPFDPTHSTLSSLRRIESRILLLPPILHSTLQSIRLISTYNDALRGTFSISAKTHQATAEFTRNYISAVEVYMQNATYLLAKIRGTAQLLADTLVLRQQMDAQKIGENTLVLTESAGRDGATVRVITVVMLLYLPATFVAVGLHDPSVSRYHQPHKLRN